MAAAGARVLSSASWSECWPVSDPHVWRMRMSSRALLLAAVMLLVGCSSAAQAQENLEAGKSPSQIFAGTCTACHKSPRGLLKTVPAGALAGFLRQHYTTSPNMADVLSSYLVSNGATDTRLGGQPKDGKGSKDGPKEGPREGNPRDSAREAKFDARSSARPEPDGTMPQPRNSRRQARTAPVPEQPPAATPPPADGAAVSPPPDGSDGQVPAQATAPDEGQPIAPPEVR